MIHKLCFTNLKVVWIVRLLFTFIRQGKTNKMTFHRTKYHSKGAFVQRAFIWRLMYEGFGPRPISLTYTLINNYKCIYSSFLLCYHNTYGRIWRDCLSQEFDMLCKQAKHAWKNNDDLIVHVLKGSVKDEPSKHHTNQLDAYLYRRSIISCYPWTI
jgi:hypothetical protein